MAGEPNDFRDPKVTSGTTKANGGGIGKWIGIAIAAIVIALLLAWLLGAFADDDVDTAVVPAENGVTAVAPAEGDVEVIEGDAEVVRE